MLEGAPLTTPPRQGAFRALENHWRWCSDAEGKYFEDFLLLVLLYEIYLFCWSYQTYFWDIHCMLYKKRAVVPFSDAYQFHYIRIILT